MAMKENVDTILFFRITKVNMLNSTLKVHPGGDGISSYPPDEHFETFRELGFP